MKTALLCSLFMLFIINLYATFNVMSKENPKYVFIVMGAINFVTIFIAAIGVSTIEG